MGRISSRHDKFVRAILGDRELAIDYFKSFLPQDLSSRLDFSSLIQISDSYLSKQLQKSMSDIVYSCRIQGSEKYVKVVLLVEHKSYVEKYAPIQIGSYIFAGYQKQISNKESLSLIIPILFYHGLEKWEYCTVSQLFDTFDVRWQRYIPNFDYIYNDLCCMSDGELEALSNQFLAASVLALKHAMDEVWLNEHALSIFAKAVSGSGNQLEQLTVYFFENSNSSEAVATRIIELIPEQLKDKIMSTFDRYELKGMEKGMETSKIAFVKNLLSNTDFTVSQIAKLVEVTEEFVIRIQSEAK